MRKMTHIGEAFRFVRLSKGMEQKRVAEGAAISESYLSQLENGHRDPSWTAIKTICQSLGVPVTFITVLLEGAEPDVRPFVPAVSQELWNMTREAGVPTWRYP